MQQPVSKNLSSWSWIIETTSPGIEMIFKTSKTTTSFTCLFSNINFHLNNVIQLPDLCEELATTASVVCPGNATWYVKGRG